VGMAQNPELYLASSWQRKDDPTKDAATRDRDYRSTGHMGQWHETWPRLAGFKSIVIILRSF